MAALMVAQMNHSILNGNSHQGLSGFQTELVRQLEGLVKALPNDVARLSVGHVPGHPDWPEPYFEVIPANPRAATFKGVAVGTDLDLTVGHSWREFYGFARGGTIIRGARWEDEFRSIWLAVVAGRLKERLSLDSRRNVSGWDSRLSLDDKELVFRNGRRTEKLLGKETVEIVTYESYV